VCFLDLNTAELCLKNF